MKPGHITCNGSQLQHELAQLRARGAIIESIDVKVGGKNSAYQINFVDLNQVKLFPRQCETPEKTVAPDSVKSELATRNQLKMTPKFLVMGQPLGQKPSGAETVGVNISIPDRISNLKALAIGSGRVKRDKPKTKPDYARTPHNSD